MPSVNSLRPQPIMLPPLHTVTKLCQSKTLLTPLVFFFLFFAEHYNLKFGLQHLLLQEERACSVPKA